MPENTNVEASWPHSIQHLALAHRKTSLLDKPHLSVLISKNALKLGDRHHLNEIWTDDLFNNIMHSTIEGAIYAYMAKESYKALRQDFGVQETDKNLLRE